MNLAFVPASRYVVAMVQPVERGGDGRSGPFRFGGRELAATEVSRIREIVRAQREATRSDLARAVCRELGWSRPNGASRVRACQDLLKSLAEEGEINLPTSRLRQVRRVVGAMRRGHVVDAESTETASVVLRRIVVRPIDTSELARWRAEMDRHHYLGDGVIVGETIRHVAEYDGRWLALLAGGERRHSRAVTAKRGSAGTTRPSTSVCAL